MVQNNEVDDAMTKAPTSVLLAGYVTLAVTFDAGTHANKLVESGIANVTIDKENWTDPA